MKIQFKQQPFQLEAVQRVVDVFQGQPKGDSRFTLDKGRRQKVEYAGDIAQGRAGAAVLDADYGFKNNQIRISDSDVLDHIRMLQRMSDLPVSDKLEGRYNLTVEMETGTGKTYTYIRTMFELYEQYGWSKFIVVVPSIAIREGVLKTFQMTEEHFMSQYGIKARHFVYNSKQLHHIEQFAADGGINVMIINSQAFAARGQDARRIYMELDDFASRRPIDVIASTNPIMIVDEPQSVEGAKTKESLKVFNPLFTLRYSATHKEDYNKIYRLDALDAYNMKLVKKIDVKGISVKGSAGTESYLYLEGIDVSAKRAPIARLEFETMTQSGLKKQTRKVDQGYDLYTHSGEMEQYRGYRVAEINGQNNTVTFTNGVTLRAGDVRGDVNELHFRRIQIRETIKSHLEKERKLFSRGIKVLSLFFIDEVAKYRQYGESGEEQGGEYADIFEEEYANLVNEQLSLFADDPYVRYLNGIQGRATHKGYFSIDKKSRRFVDPKVSGRNAEAGSDDADAYDLIMRDKERLLSFGEPTRFIFSHSALKEGWDNPNVFQICTLKHSDSTMKKRQEVGRGLRLCVNQQGERIDAESANDDVHEINVLTVVASESYELFARQLQSEIAETLADRPRKADHAFFLDRVLTDARGETLKLDDSLSRKLLHGMIRDNYVDDDYKLTDTYFADAEQGEVKLPEELEPYREPVLHLLKSIYTPDRTSLAENGRERNVNGLVPNANFNKREFQELWTKINRKSVYTVKFDSSELIRNCIHKLETELRVPALRYTVAYGEMKTIESKEKLLSGESFELREKLNQTERAAINYSVKYDLVGKLMDAAQLTRRTIIAILSGVKEATFMQFRENPEEFMLRAARLINEQKASTVIQSITYDAVNETYGSDIFTASKLGGKLGENAFPVEKHIYDYVVTDSRIEQKFAKELDVNTEVLVYAKLPGGFYIPTPVGKYNPDWAIVFKEGEVKHIYFIAETKGSMSSMDIRGVENAKIACARKHFASLNTAELRYDVVDSYEELLNKVMK
ncbi:DEAD/DEAH box helicase family protein [Saccharibacillus sp. CPCC 101409]|uniref:type III restriction-modification system endonuclease n=1 Tax=Saccharibacillus sp. CPCC 101409 TaxID=3058041 RepID=UPI0026737B10|nr:DEAD/DEAH box helicase family protein [Saccharibacillus sp. CPCC 101409]MDO3409898.1 DEAD/DEAH box helicase family protein [Saccharibacillus sp. CPCC 101409]